jgi:hypothetical protein
MASSECCGGVVPLFRYVAPFFRYSLLPIRYQKRMRNAERRSLTSATFVAARALQGAHAFRRSTAALVQGTRASQGLSTGPGFAERGA